jgi:hypothetical protein
MCALLVQLVVVFHKRLNAFITEYFIIDNATLSKFYSYTLAYKSAKHSSTIVWIRDLKHRSMYISRIKYFVQHLISLTWYFHHIIKIVTLSSSLVFIEKIIHQKNRKTILSE